MSESEVFGRVLIAFDLSPHSLTALEAAVEVAALFDAELLGVFVEDVDLLRLADLGFASEIRSFSATIQPLDAERMRLQLRAAAERARRTLAVSAERARVPWSFHVARGPVAAAVMEKVGGRDLISLGRLGWSALGRAGLGRTARMILGAAQVSALVLRQGGWAVVPLCALYDGSKAARRGLDVAARLARRETPTVVVVAGDDRAAERLEHEAAELLRSRGVRARFRRLVGVDRKTVLAAVRAGAPGLIVLPAEAGEDLGDFLAEAETPVLVVRDVE